MPDPASTPLTVFCDGCHEIKLKYDMPEYRNEHKKAGRKTQEAAVHLK